MSNRAKVTVLVSGDGSNFEAIVQASRDGRLAADVGGMIASRAGIGALERARRLGVLARVLCPKNYAHREDWDFDLETTLREWQTDWVVLAGFLSLIGPKVLAAFHGRIVNIHPALLPQFGGPGMYGHKVHEAVIAAQAKETGITVHLVDAEYDHGPTLAQAKIPVRTNDTVATLSERLRALEHDVYPRVLNDLVRGRLTKP